MEAEPQKWGNSWAVRIPNAFAKQMNLGGGVNFDMQMEGDALILRPKTRRLTLDEIVASIDETDPHGETDWGGELGREILS